MARRQVVGHQFKVVRCAVVLIIGLALASAGGRLGAAETVTHPYVGVTYVDRTGTGMGTEKSLRLVHMHIVQVDLTAPGIRFKVSAPAGAREVIRQTTLDFLSAEHAQVAINAHFFLPFPSADPEAFVIGIAASEGTVYSLFESPVQDYALVADAPGLNIDAANHASIIHWDPSATGGLHVRERVTLWNTVAGSAQVVTDGVVSVPSYRDEQHPQGLLRNGGPGDYSNAKSWYDQVNARTSIGLSRDNRTLTLFTSMPEAPAWA